MNIGIKILFILFKICFGDFALAKGIPADAIILGRERAPVLQNYSRRALRANCRYTLEEKLEEIEQQLQAGKYSEAINGDAQYACREVIIVGEVEKTGYYQKTIYFEVHCAPRSLSEKQVLSQARSCETQPTPECYSESFLKRVDKIKNTTFSYSGMQC